MRKLTYVLTQYLLKRIQRIEKKISKFLRDIDIYDKLLTTLKTTVNKLISWVSSVFKVNEDTLVDTLKKETKTYINLMEQLITEDKNLMEELKDEYRYIR